MRRLGLAALLIASLASSGCPSPYYAQPGLSEPHADVVIRFWRGDHTDGRPIETEIVLNRMPIELRTEEDHAIHVRVRPGAGHWLFRTSHFHEEESVMTHTTYTTGRHASVHRTFTPVVDRVHEDSCDQMLLIHALPGSRYVLTYTYASTTECSVTCEHMRRGAPVADGCE